MTTTQNLTADTFAIADAFLATKTAEELLQMSSLLRGQQDEAGRIARSAISDTITNRLDLNDLMEEIYMAEDYEGDYHDAMVEAIARKAN
jgi:hypothetical protein